MAVNSSQPSIYCVIIIFNFIFRSQVRRLRLFFEEEEENEDELNWYDDEVGVVIVATPRSYKSRRLRLRQQKLCTEVEADYEDLGD